MAHLRSSVIDSEASMLVLFALIIFAMLKLVSGGSRRITPQPYIFDLNSIKIN
jgi:hypothetical protein